MAISYVGTAQAAGTVLTLPAGIVAGDYIIWYGHRGTTSAPGLPSGYTSISTQSANSNSHRIAYKVAVGTESGTTVTSTTALSVHAAIYRGVSAIGAASGTTNVSSTNTNVPAITTMTNTSGTSWVVAVAGSNQTTSQGTITSTTTRGTSQVGTGEMHIMGDTNGGVTSWAAKTSTAGAAAVGAGGSVELIATVPIVLTPGVPALTITRQTPTVTVTNDLNVVPISLSDNFDDNSISASWTKNGNWARVNEQNQRLEVDHPTTSEYNSLQAATTYDLTSKSIYAEAVDVGNQTLVSHQAVLGLSFDATNSLYMSAGNGAISTFKKVAGTDIQAGSYVTYNSTNHRWWRIRENGGIIYFDTSANGTTWTNFSSVANPFAVTALTPFLQTGNWQTEATPSYAYFDNFNTAASAGTTLNPGIATLTTTLYAPSLAVSNNQAITTNLSTLTLTPQLPALQLGTVLTPGLSSLTVAPQTPALKLGEVLTPGIVTLTTATQTPTIVGTANVAITTLVTTLTVTRLTPSLAISNNIALTPGLATLTTSPQTPSLSVGSNVSLLLNLTTLSLTPLAPTVSFTANVTLPLSTTALTLTAQSPSVSTSSAQSIVLSTASLTLSPQTPSIAITAHQFVTPGIVSLTTNRQTPTVTATAHQVVSPGLLSLLSTAFAPSVSATANVSLVPGKATLTITRRVPTVDNGSGTVVLRKYYLDTDGNVYWVVNQTIGLVEKV